MSKQNGNTSPSRLAKQNAIVRAQRQREKMDQHETVDISESPYANNLSICRKLPSGCTNTLPEPFPVTSNLARVTVDPSIIHSVYQYEVVFEPPLNSKQSRWYYFYNALQMNDDLYYVSFDGASCAHSFVYLGEREYHMKDFHGDFESLTQYQALLQFEKPGGKPDETFEDVHQRICHPNSNPYLQVHNDRKRFKEDTNKHRETVLYLRPRSVYNVQEYLLKYGDIDTLRAKLVSDEALASPTSIISTPTLPATSSESMSAATSLVLSEQEKKQSERHSVKHTLQSTDGLGFITGLDQIIRHCLALWAIKSIDSAHYDKHEHVDIVDEHGVPISIEAANASQSEDQQRRKELLANVYHTLYDNMNDTFNKIKHHKIFRVLNKVEIVDLPFLISNSTMYPLHHFKPMTEGLSSIYGSFTSMRFLETGLTMNIDVGVLPIWRPGEKIQVLLEQLANIRPGVPHIPQNTAKNYNNSDRERARGYNSNDRERGGIRTLANVPETVFKRLLGLKVWTTHLAKNVKFSLFRVGPRSKAVQSRSTDGLSLPQWYKKIHNIDINPDFFTYEVKSGGAVYHYPIEVMRMAGAQSFSGDFTPSIRSKILQLTCARPPIRLEHAHQQLVSLNHALDYVRTNGPAARHEQQQRYKAWMKRKELAEKRHQENNCAGADTSAPVSTTITVQDEDDPDFKSPFLLYYPKSSDLAAHEAFDRPDPDKTPDTLRRDTYPFKLDIPEPPPTFPESNTFPSVSAPPFPASEVNVYRGLQIGDWIVPFARRLPQPKLVFKTRPQDNNTVVTNFIQYEALDELHLSPLYGQFKPPLEFYFRRSANFDAACGIQRTRSILTDPIATAKFNTYNGLVLTNDYITIEAVLFNPPSRTSVTPAQIQQYTQGIVYESWNKGLHISLRSLDDYRGTFEPSDIENWILQLGQKSKSIREATGVKHQFLILAILSPFSPYYAIIKRVGETLAGIPSQCCDVTRLVHQNTDKKLKEYLDSLVVKINVKLGGLNWSLYQTKEWAKLLHPDAESNHNQPDITIPAYIIPELKPQLQVLTLTRCPSGKLPQLFSTHQIPKCAVDPIASFQQNSTTSIPQFDLNQGPPPSPMPMQGPPQTQQYDPVQHQTDNHLRLPQQQPRTSSQSHQQQYQPNQNLQSQQYQLNPQPNQQYNNQYQRGQQNQSRQHQPRNDQLYRGEHHNTNNRPRRDRQYQNHQNHSHDRGPMPPPPILPTISTHDFQPFPSSQPQPQPHSIAPSHYSLKENLSLQHPGRLDIYPPIYTIDESDVATVMAIGIDVCHDFSSRSHCAVVASWNPTLTAYHHIVFQQGFREEIIPADKARDAFKTLLIAFSQKNRGHLPKHIIIYRDGVSDSQLGQCLDSEVRGLISATQTLGMLSNNHRPGEYTPNITLLIAVKRHNVRMKPPPNIVDYHRDASTQNCPSGTVVDNVIVRSDISEFYLQSHTGTLGTARPTLYQLCYTSNPTLISLNDIQLLTYYLCFAHQRTNTATSLPIPTFYAHLLCYRARMYNPFFNHTIESRDPYKQQKQHGNWNYVQFPEHLIDKAFFL